MVDIFSTNLAMQLRFPTPLVKIGPNDLGHLVDGRHSTTANPELDGNMEREFKKHVRENLKEEERTGE